MRETKVCITCGKIFERRYTQPKHRFETQMFCSNRCRAHTLKNDIMSILSRLDKSVSSDQPTECWSWTRGLSSDGYGIVRYNGGSMKLVHKIVYEHWFGPVPKGYELDHLCRRRDCANPYHLEAVPHAVNVKRGEVGKNSRDKTHCPQGHPYSGDNVYVSPSNRRHCRICVRENKRRYLLRLKEQSQHA